MITPRILCVDDEVGMLEVCHDALARLGNIEVVTCPDPAGALELLRSQNFDLVVTDIRMPHMTGIELVRHVRAIDKQLPVVIMTGFPSVETAVEAMRLGAVDYVTKPFHPDDLTNTVKRLLKIRTLEQENELLRRRVEGKGYTGDMLGTGPAMQQVFDTIERVADNNVDVLIQGETGTGKELVARAIHRHSNRREQPFVPVNCGAIPENLLEAEFFGYEKGAFTGAESRSIGLLEYANGGTLFLDEVAELPIHMQAKLLRVLQERKLRRVGGREEISFDVRVISASASDLINAVKEKVFREDLFYRLNVVTIELPPLRQRGEDIPLLIGHFVTRYAKEMNKSVNGVDAKAMAALQAYPWPGNIRELQNILRRAIALTHGDRIMPADLPDYIAGSSDTESSTGGYYRLRDACMARFEKDYLTRLLTAHHGDVTAATKDAEVPRGSFYRLLKKYGIDPGDFR